jgi:IS5 family transposase
LKWASNFFQTTQAYVVKGIYKITSLPITEKTSTPINTPVGRNAIQPIQPQLDRAGLNARKGQWVDASFVKAPISRSTPDENTRIQLGKMSEDWTENQRSQNDTDAPWTKKDDKSHYGNKNPVNVDNTHKLVRKYAITDASVHDTHKLDEQLDSGKTRRVVWGDNAFHSAEIEAKLKAKDYRNHIYRKGVRGKPLTAREKQGNKTRSKTRCRVEHGFASMAQWGGKAVRGIGLART